MLDEQIYKDWQAGASIFSLTLKYDLDKKVIRNILHKFGFKRRCQHCGKTFKVNNLNLMYCSKKCRLDHDKIKKKDKPKSFDDLVKELRDKGIRYSDWQKERTLKILKGARPFDQRRT